MYTDKVMDHFNNPRNVGVIEDADGVGEVGNPVCGDVMKITITVDGRTTSTTSSSRPSGAAPPSPRPAIVTEMARGMSLQEAVDITKQGRSPTSSAASRQRRCTARCLATDGLKVAIDDYLVKNGREADVEQILKALPKEHEHSSH